MAPCTKGHAAGVGKAMKLSDDHIITHRLPLFLPVTVATVAMAVAGCVQFPAPHKAIVDQDLHALEMSLHDQSINQPWENWLFKHGVTPLHFAISHGYLAGVKCVVRNGADLSLPIVQAGLPYTPLQFAIKRGKFWVAEYLVHEVHVDPHETHSAQVNTIMLARQAGFGFQELADHIASVPHAP